MLTNTTMKNLTNFLLILISFCSFTPANAIAKPKSQFYQIELITFKNNNTSEDIAKETWPAAKLKLPTNYIDLTASATDSNSYTLLPKNELKYTNIYNNIRYSKRYTAINHIGWLQPKKDMNKSIPVYFSAGQVYFNNTAESPELMGTLKLTSKKYVHAKLDLLLNLPAKTDPSYAKQFELVKNFDGKFSDNVYLQSFLLSEDRRLKNNELNYFDHPVFSAIVVVSEV